jgi:hypothetical protein
MPNLPHAINFSKIKIRSKLVWGVKSAKNIFIFVKTNPVFQENQNPLNKRSAEKHYCPLITGYVTICGKFPARGNKSKL